MGKKLTEIQKQQIVQHYSNGLSIRKISQQIGIPHSTVHKTINRDKQSDNSVKPPKKGRNPVLSTRDKNHLKHEVHKDPKVSASELERNSMTILGKKVGRKVISRALNEIGYKQYIARKKPYLQPSHITQRLQFATQYFCKDISYWKNIIFSDEAKFDLFNASNTKKIWKQPNNAFQIPYINFTSNFG